jgi:hypothetical protein
LAALLNGDETDLFGRAEFDAKAVDLVEHSSKILELFRQGTLTFKTIVLENH